MNEFSHLDENGNPMMVDIGGKEMTHRVAIASACVSFPAEVWKVLNASDFIAKKGSVFQTAIIAGIMGVKKTSELIPLCHPLLISKADIRIEKLPEEMCIKIFCEVSLDGKTGVEMEALTGASIAALTVYDMCKALSHEIVIQDIKLESKTGGKSDFSLKK